MENLKYKEIPCTVNGSREESYPFRHMNVQVSMTKWCNAMCRFCIYRDNTYSQMFNLYKFKKGLTKLRSLAAIPCVTFTGGEPSLMVDTLKQCVDFIKELDDSIHIKIHTNGVHLRRVLSLGAWRVSLSRHGITDQENFEVFGTNTVPTLHYLKSLSDEEKSHIHIDCNLTKGYVDTPEKMQQFLETFGNIGIQDFGFIGLMPVNKYAKENYVDISIAESLVTANALETPTPCIPNKHCQYIKEDGKVHCECNERLYLTQEGHPVSFYTREVKDRNCEEANVVFYENEWRQGYSGRTLEI